VGALESSAFGSPSVSRFSEVVKYTTLSTDQKYGAVS
jgi:hypothetical protein